MRSTIKLLIKLLLNKLYNFMLKSPFGSVSIKYVCMYVCMCVYVWELPKRAMYWTGTKMCGRSSRLNIKKANIIRSTITNKFCNVVTQRKISNLYLHTFICTRPIVGKIGTQMHACVYRLLSSLCRHILLDVGNKSPPLSYVLCCSYAIERNSSTVILWYCLSNWISNIKECLPLVVLITAQVGLCFTSSATFSAVVDKK